MKVLVAGGAGYIGGIVADQLLQAGHDVTVFDSLVKGYRAAAPVGAELVQGEIHDRTALDAVMGRATFDAVMHFAAFIEAGESMVDPGRYFYNNVAGSLNLIEAATAAGVGRFVFSSSAAVYASKNAPLCETDTLAPANAYGATKLMVEQILGWYGQIKGLRFAALRYFNACGAAPERSRGATPVRGEAHRPETHLIPLVLQVALGQRAQISIYGADYPTPDGTCIRDYIHVVDLAQAHLLALEALAENERIVCNLGNGAGYSVRQVIAAARAVTGHPIPAVETPRRPGDAAILVANAGKARALLGWQPGIPDLHDIIADAWAWHRAHPRGYDA
ncbi:MAG: UDP-glucose 4-epimerase GalE [Chloroflexi bacterium HGW-Chloroflexi-1]|nr:MAG: UDP-glucose 4-epimerase GalE [Chloroflexi bacterium HGW-Chloroflexi-1]